MTDDSWRAERFAPARGTPLCSVATIPDGGGCEVVFGDGKDAFRVALFRVGETVTGFLNRCPHFGIPLNVGAFSTSRGRVFCASHYARFRIRDGYCEDGPCQGASLEGMPLVCERGFVFVA